MYYTCVLRFKEDLHKQDKKEYEALYFAIDEGNFFAGFAIQFSESKFFIIVRPSQAEGHL